MIVSMFRFVCFTLSSLFYLQGKGADLAVGQNSDNPRDPRILSIFQIINFPNDPCIGTGSRNGTCYTGEECGNRNGIAAGPCANGFGVCCIFLFGCGKTTYENHTNFDVVGAGPGYCSLTVCKCSSNICQLRLDFNTMVIAGPSTSSASVGRTRGGAFGSPKSYNRVATKGQCITDSFSVTNPGGHSPPVICGTNSGDHMYVDASGMCNQLIFQMSSISIQSPLVVRQWAITITQFHCDDWNRAPKGCLQYHFGSQLGTVRSYNFGQHIANQKQTICVRRERGNCRICWTAEVDDFALSDRTDGRPRNNDRMCCGYGGKGENTRGYDCLIIHGAETPLGAVLKGGSRFCGRNGGLITNTNAAITPTTICSTVLPFSVTFLSDLFEFREAVNGESLNLDVGFRLTYIMDSTNCPP